eukprot:2534299-Pyramimonas_sp.AAC.1
MCIRDRFKTDTAVGVDHWAPRSLLLLPPSAVGVYAELLNQCERYMTWPTQTMLGIISPLPKAKDAERPSC